MWFPMVTESMEDALTAMTLIMNTADTITVKADVRAGIANRRQ